MNNRKLNRIMLARDYGFCMGVKRAIKIAEESGGTGSNPVNVINEIVHNDAVVKKLSAEGVGSVPSVADAPGGTVIVSAHGAPPTWFSEAEKRGLNVIDATCPLVIRIHKIIHKLVENGYQIIHYGDLHHDETKGVVGQAPDGRVDVVRNVEDLRALDLNGHKLAMTSQTTAGVSDFEKITDVARELYPDIEIFNTICDATSRRQAAVLDLAPEVELMLVVGSKSSANSTRLRSISEAICKRAYLINSASEVQDDWLEGISIAGITAGASTPDFLVEEVIEWLVDYSHNTAEVIRPEKKKSRRQLMMEKQAEQKKAAS